MSGERPRPGSADRSETPEGVPGVDIPDRRGRTGLNRVGRDLARNPRIRVRDVEVLTSSWYVTRRTTFDFQHADGSWSTQERETYDRGDGACLFLHDVRAGTVLLVRQFRYAAYVNEHPDGMLLELPAGLLDDNGPEDAIRREVEEETGVRLGEVTHVFSLYMSPGSVTERLLFYTGAYRSGEVADGSRAGLRDEGEDIEVVEMPFEVALGQIGREICDAKTVLMLQWAALAGPFAGRRAAPAD